MEVTNSILKISGGTYGNIGYIVFFAAAVYFAYCLISVALEKSRVEKLKEVKKLIEEGHERVMANESKED